MLAFYSGDLATARAGHEAALAVDERTGFRDPTALVTYSRLASVCLLTFELDRAVRLAEECLRRCDELGEQWARGTALWTRGAARWLSGDIAAAIEDALACLRIKEQLDDLHTIAMSFDLLSVCLVAPATSSAPPCCTGPASALWTLLNAPVLVGPAYAEIRKSDADTARCALGEERFDAPGGGTALPCRCPPRWPWRGARRPAAAALAVPAPWPGRRGRPGRSPGASGRSPAWSPTASATGRSPSGCTCPSGRSTPTWSTSSRKLGFTSRTQLAAWVLEQPAHGRVPRTDLTCTARYIPIFIKIGGRYLPCRHQSFTVGRQSLRMSGDSGAGLSRRQVIAAGTTGLIAVTAAGRPAPRRAAVRGPRTAPPSRSTSPGATTRHGPSSCPGRRPAGRTGPGSGSGGGSSPPPSAPAPTR